MDFATAVTSALNNYINFEGRASRSEYWWYILFAALIYIAALMVNHLLGVGIATLLVNLGLLAPTLAVTTRRLHDINKSGWWQLIYFIPLIGTLVMFWFLIGKSDVFPNRFDGSSSLS